MGFFSEIASEARRGMAQPPPPVNQMAPPPSPAPEPNPAPPAAVPEIPAAPPAAAPETPSAPVESAPAPAQPEPTQAPEPPTIDLTPGADTTDEAGRRKAHEDAEAKRKAEFDARQAEKRAAEQAALDKLAALSDDDVSRLSAHRVAADVEKITRRSMKEQVADHIQSLCQKDPAFARKTMHPRKSMAHCFRYISRKAFEYIRDELEADGIKPRPGSDGYGCDVPDGLCFQWAEDYFNDPDAKEDKTEEEKFVPRPYIPSAKAPSGAKQSGTKKKQAMDKKQAEPKNKADIEQITLGGFAATEEKAG